MITSRDERRFYIFNELIKYPKTLKIIEEKAKQRKDKYVMRHPAHKTLSETCINCRENIFFLLSGMISIKTCPFCNINLENKEVKI